MKAFKDPLEIGLIGMLWSMRYQGHVVRHKLSRMSSEALNMCAKFPNEVIRLDPILTVVFNNQFQQGSVPERIFRGMIMLLKKRQGLCAGFR